VLLGNSKLEWHCGCTVVGLHGVMLPGHAGLDGVPYNRTVFRCSVPNCNYFHVMIPSEIWIEQINFVSSEVPNLGIYGGCQ
jgi:hypothetical protein